MFDKLVLRNRHDIGMIGAVQLLQIGMDDLYSF